MSQSHRYHDAARIKAAINPYDFYLHELGIGQFGYRSGSWRVAGLCPFHHDNKPGSFKVNVEIGAFKCWSCGVSGGDIITFIQDKYDLPFRIALEKLRNEWRVA